MKGNKAIICLRCSTQEQRQKGFSLITQLENIKPKISDYQIVETVEDVFSAWKDGSANGYLKKIYAKCKRNKSYTDYILFQKVDRFSRDTEKAWEWIRKFKKLGIEINFTDQWIPYNTGVETMLLNMYLGLSQTESENISRRTSQGVAAIKTKGYFANAIVPTGYKKVLVGDRKSLESDGTVKLQVIKKCFDLFIFGGYTRTELQKMFAVTLNMKRTAFFSMFSNHIYSGCNLVDGQYLDGNWNGIITLSYFLDMQSKIKEELRLKSKPSKNNRDIFYLLGSLLDSNNEIMRGSTTTKKLKSGGKSKHPYYSSRTKGQPRLKKEEAHSLFQSFLDSLAMNESVLNDISKRVRSKMDSPLRSIRSKKANLQKEIDTANSRLEKIKEDYSNGIIEGMEYKEMRQFIQQKINDLQIKVEKTSDNVALKMGNIEKLIKSIGLVGKLFKKANSEQKRVIINCIFPKGFELDLELNKVRTKYINYFVSENFDLQANTSIIIQETDHQTNDDPLTGGTGACLRTVDTNRIIKMVSVLKEIA